MLDGILTEHPEVDFVQIQLNYLDWENDTIQSRKCYETAKRHRKPVIVMEPVKGGTLADIPQKAENLFRTAGPSILLQDFTSPVRQTWPTPSLLSKNAYLKIKT